jgi:Xaa-Pro aminopeptidase
MDALRECQDKIRFAQVRHEEAAAFMACGYAKYMGRLGVCLATSRPGGEPGSLEDLQDSAEAVRPQFLEIVHQSGLENATIGYEANDGYQPCSYISMRLYGATIWSLLLQSLDLRPADALLVRKRAVLTQREIAHLEQACSVACRTYEKRSETLREGRRPQTQDVRSRACRARGGTRSYKARHRTAESGPAAREVMNAPGCAKQFKHSTGHSLGFAAIDHNALPRPHPKSPDVLETGMTFDVEPAVYYEDYGGLRHCDMVPVTQLGMQLLTPFKTILEDLTR